MNSDYDDSNGLNTPVNSKDDNSMAMQNKKHPYAKEFDSSQPPIMVVGMRFMNH